MHLRPCPFAGPKVRKLKKARHTVVEDMSEEEALAIRKAPVRQPTSRTELSTRIRRNKRPRIYDDSEEDRSDVRVR
jgi:hypothetical protein